MASALRTSLPTALLLTLLLAGCTWRVEPDQKFTDLFFACLLARCTWPVEPALVAQSQATLTAVAPAAGAAAPSTPIPTAAMLPALPPIPADTPLPALPPIPTRTAQPASTARPLATSESINEGNVPQRWEGQWADDPMILYIETANETNFSAKLNWPTYGNTITQVEGMFVSDFGNFVQQARWAYVEGFEPETTPDGSWMIFTESAYVQGGEVALHGYYLGHVRSDGTMVGAYFDEADAMEPNGTFSLTLQTD